METAYSDIGIIAIKDVDYEIMKRYLNKKKISFTSFLKVSPHVFFRKEHPLSCSETSAPAIAGASIEMFNMLEESTELRDHLEEVTAYYREQLVENGFDIIPGTHPCVPIMHVQADFILHIT